MIGRKQDTGTVLSSCESEITGHYGPYLPNIPDSQELLRKSASNYGITARGKIITEIVDYGNLVTSGNNW